LLRVKNGKTRRDLTSQPSRSYTGNTNKLTGVKMSNTTEILATGKCRICKYTRVYDWSDQDFCAAPCENCGAESYDIKKVNA